MRAVITALAVSIAAILALPALAADTIDAKPGDLKMTLSIAGSKSVTAYEPVVVRKDLTNVSGEEVVAALSPSYTTRIEIRNSSGKLVGQTPLLPLPLDFLTAIRKYSVGQTRTFYLNVSAIYNFTNPGDYTITVWEGRSTVSGDGFDAIAQGSVDLTVLPFNQKALDTRLKQLFAPVTEGQGGLPPATPQMSSDAILHAMWAVRHDAIIPYLVKTAEYGAGWPTHSARALYRLGTPKAKEALKGLTERKDRVGENARYGLKYGLSVDGGDWHTE